MEERQQGVIKWFNSEKGYGFIGRDGGQDVFVHASACDKAVWGGREPQEGEQVTFLLEEGPKGLQAQDVRPADGGADESSADAMEMEAEMSMSEDEE